MNLRVKKWPDTSRPGINGPAYPGDAGLDLYAVEEMTIPAHGYVDIPHGFSVEIPLGFFGYIMPRSSAIKHNNGNMVVMASPIDSGYRGQIFTMVRNNGDAEIVIEKGQRVSQMVILPHAMVDALVWSEDLSESNRGTHGFGSTGR